MPADEPAVTCWWHGGGHGAQGATCNERGTQQVTLALQVQPPPMAPPASRYPTWMKEDLFCGLALPIA